MDAMTRKGTDEILTFLTQAGQCQSRLISYGGMAGQTPMLFLRRMKKSYFIRIAENLEDVDVLSKEGNT